MKLGGKILRLDSWRSMVLVHVCLLFIGTGVLERVIFGQEEIELTNKVLQLLWVFCGLLALLGFGGALGLGARVLLGTAQGTEINSLRMQVIWAMSYVFCAAVGGTGAVLLYFHLS